MLIRFGCAAVWLACVLASRNASAAMMQAAVVTGSRIAIEWVRRPLPRPGQLLIRIHDAGVNPADWKRASGTPEDPSIGKASSAHVAIPGMDAAGVVEAIGREVSGYQVGDAVMLWSRSAGTYAQFVAVSADDVARKPERLSFAQASAIPHAALAACNLLMDIAKVHAGQTVLVLGGAGGVGSAAVQIARIQGAHVIATTSARNADYVRKLGADTVIDYTAQHFEEQVRNVDIAVNAVDTDDAYRALAVLRPGGYLVSLAGLPSPAQCSQRAVTCSGRSGTAKPSHGALEQLARWAQSGLFTVNIDRSFGLNEVLAAWAYSQAGHTRGKAVIRIVE
jgi:NADPH:quinone reductase-like Zn-dependent oxidoreductase